MCVCVVWCGVWVVVVCSVCVCGVCVVWCGGVVCVRCVCVCVVCVWWAITIIIALTFRHLYLGEVFK